MEAWWMQSQSLCIVLLMLAGILVRKNRKLHVRVMSVAMVWDILLILQIELSRSAILKASKAVDKPTTDVSTTVNFFNPKSLLVSIELFLLIFPCS